MKSQRMGLFCFGYQAVYRTVLHILLLLNRVATIVEYHGSLIDYRRPWGVRPR